jgi:hypothetical protein
MKKQGFIALVLFLFILVSCEKPTDHAIQDLKVSKIVKSFLFSQDSEIYIFDYSVQNEIKVKLSYTYYNDFWIVYRFDGQKRLSEFRFENANESLLYKTDYTYGNNSVTGLQTVDCQFSPRKYDSIVYTLGNDGLATQAVEYGDPDGGWDLYSTYHFTWMEGSLIRIIADKASSSDTTEYKYDTKRNPLNITNLPFMFFSGGLLFSGQHNNSMIRDKNIAIQNTDVFEYNEDNYPVKIIKNSYGFSGAGTEFHFEYIPE